MVSSNIEKSDEYYDTIMVRLGDLTWLGLC